MCGRSCLTLSPSEIQHACKYRTTPSFATAGANADDDADYKTPDYRAEYNCGRSYAPSHNVTPTDVTPVLVAAAHFDTDAAAADRVLLPAMWGLVPAWHPPTAPAHKHGLSTNNCRLEGLATSKLYAPLLRSGQRCVIVCEGFYEWRTTTKADAKPAERDVYYFYVPQEWSTGGVQAEGEQAEDRAIKFELSSDPDDETPPSKPDNDDDNEPVVMPDDPRGQQHTRLLHMAGLFDVWTNAAGDSVYSYAVITFESAPNFAWLHHRTPAILESAAQIADWLDFQRVDANEALATLRPFGRLEWHRVSKAVNNARNKSAECNRPSKALLQRAAKRNGMEMWLSQAAKRVKGEDVSKDNDK